MQRPAYLQFLGHGENFARALIALSLATACNTPARTEHASRAPDAGVRAAPSTKVVASAPVGSAEGLPPLAGSWLERLELESGGVAFVSPPVGARERRPVIVAAHGAGDRAEWACGGWRLAVSSYAFVLCPQGSPVGGERFGWASSLALNQAVERALVALRARYGVYLSTDALVYAGFSQGAILSEHVLTAVPGRFEVAIFAEGGYRTLESGAFWPKFAAAGGSRVFIVCGGAGCFGVARRSRPILEARDLEVFVAGDAKAGHNLNERMQKALRAAFPQVVAGLPGWDGFRSRSARAPR